MSILRFVTLTGVDEKTDLDLLNELGIQYRFAEWGVLYSPTRAGKDPRYPSLEWIERFAQFADENELYAALHLCGTAVEDLFDLATIEHKRGTALADHPGRAVLDLAHRFGRVQLNFRPKLSQVDTLETLIGLLTRSEKFTRVIFQWNNPTSQEVCNRLSYKHGVEVLVDESGGRGLLPAQWPRLSETHRRTGYAGGLGPDNLAEQLPSIAKAADGRAFWVDMETKLRNQDDEFDLSRCEQVLATAAAFEQKQRVEAGAVHGTGMQPTFELKGFWLDWWVGHVMGYNMAVPPVNAYAAVYLHRPSGHFEGFQPTEDSSLALKLLRSERIALMPGPLPEPSANAQGLDDEDAQEPEDAWTAKAFDFDLPWAPGTSLVEAGLRAIVAKHLGLVLPSNPMALPPL